MATTWEVSDGKDVLGPVTEEHVIGMIGNGLPESMLVRPAGTEAWKSVRTHAPFAMALEQRAAAQRQPPLPFPHPTPPPQIVYVQAPPPAYYAPAPPLPPLATRATASAVRIAGGVLVVCGLLGTVPGCIAGGPVGILIAIAISFLGYFMTKVKA